MACDLATVQADACESGIGAMTDQIALLRLWVQLQADYVNATNPGLDTSPDAIMARACTSGIGKETDMLRLLKLGAQLLCDQSV